MSKERKVGEGNGEKGGGSGGGGGVVVVVESLLSADLAALSQGRDSGITW